MAYRGSRGVSRGGRGEALRQLLQQATSDLPEEHEENPADLRISGSSSQAPRPMGRSAALMKLLDSSSSLSGRRSMISEASPQVPRTELIPSRSSPMSAPSTSHVMRDPLPAYMGAMRGVRNIGMRGREMKSGIESRYERSVREASPDRLSMSRVSHRVEEEIMKPMASLAVEEEELDKPPVINKGSYGKGVNVAANYIRLNVEKCKGVFMYDVKFAPDVDALRVRFNLMKDAKDIIGDTKSFDGSILYLPFQLSEKVVTCNLKMPTDGSEVAMKISFVKKLRMGDSEVIHLYNVLFKRVMNILGFIVHGRNFFDPKSAIPIPSHKLEVWPGYITAINEFEDGVMLCCDASHRVLRTQTVYELMTDLMSLDRHNWKNEFLNVIIGQSVLTGYNNKTYRVDDVAFDETPNDRFQKKDGSKISYIEYYKHHYNIAIKYPEQPLLKSRLKARIRDKSEELLVNLVPEFCYLTGLTDTMRADMRMMKDIAQCTRISPNQRQYALNEFIKNLNSNEQAQKVLSSWGLSLARSNIKLAARVIPPEDVRFGGDVTHRGNFSADWTKAATSSNVLSAVNLNKWVVICTNRDERVVATFVDMVRKCSPQLGIKVNPPQVQTLPNDSIQAYLKALQNSKGMESELAVIVFPISRSDKYNAVKKWCCVDNPIPSQVVLTKTIRRPDKLRSITQKIVLQINCKLGGALWAVDIPVKCAMVIGLDTYHDPAKKGNSVGAVVASLNKPLTRWFSKVFTHSPGLELSDGLEISALACLLKFKEVNNVYPEQLIIYRDGVSDGQLEIVENFEIGQILIACKRISPSYLPKILVVIVQKRINTRIFTEERNEYVNPSPGSVLDHSVTRRHLWDFFLVSQSIKQGTVSPTHYIVLYNTTKMGADQVQRLTYKLTHLYYNWTGTIRVPAPCQVRYLIITLNSYQQKYAHKLAYLVGESIHREAAASLEDKLFFL